MGYYADDIENARDSLLELDEALLECGCEVRIEALYVPLMKGRRLFWTNGTEVVENEFAKGT